MMPPCVYPNPFQAQFPMRTTFINENKAFSTPKVLNALSQALKKSIQNYEEKCTKNDENCPQIQEEATIQVENTKTVQKGVEIIIDEETPLENLKNTKEEGKSETEIKKVPTPDKPKEVLQQPTDDEIPSDSKSLNVISKKKNKKIRKEEKGNKYIVEVPEIDPIDTVSLPSYVLSTKTLAKRKELLMLRKVNDPAEYMKMKKEKRQIRMLGN